MSLYDTGRVSHCRRARKLRSFVLVLVHVHECYTRIRLSYIIYSFIRARSMRALDMYTTHRIDPGNLLLHFAQRQS